MGSASGWFVALGSLISIIGTVVTSWLTLQATLKRERQTREYELRVKMAEFQFEWILKLQDTMTEFHQMVITRTLSEERSDAASRDVDGVTYDLLANSIQKLTSRIFDKNIRSLLSEFYDLGMECVARKQAEGSTFADENLDPEQAHAHMVRRLSEFLNVHETANKRIGVVLRSLYDPKGT